MQIHHFDPARAVLIVVDMQNDFVAAGAPLETPDARAMVPRLTEALALCRELGVRVIYTAQVHRPDGSDYGEFGALHLPVISQKALVDGTPGVEIFPEIAPLPGEHVIKKHRYSAFFGTDLDIILRSWRIDTVIISGTTTENCCLSTARDALYNNYRVLFLSDATATCDYPDRGFGAMNSTDLHQAALMVIAASTGEVITVAELAERFDSGKAQLARAS